RRLLGRSRDSRLRLANFTDAGRRSKQLTPRKRQKPWRIISGPHRDLETLVGQMHLYLGCASADLSWCSFKTGGDVRITIMPRSVAGKGFSDEVSMNKSRGAGQSSFPRQCSPDEMTNGRNVHIHR